MRSIPNTNRRQEMHAGNQPIDSIGFSTRVTNVLGAVGVTHLAELARYEERDLYRWPNLGKKSIREIREVLEAHGLVLGMKKLLFLPKSANSAVDPARTTPVHCTAHPVP